MKKTKKSKVQKFEHKGLEVLANLNIREFIKSQAPYGEQNAIELISKLVSKNARTQRGADEALAEFSNF